MSADISDKVVMVTGAGGSIGSELCRQILNCRPTKLLLFELSEFALYSIDKELRETQAAQGSQVEVVPLLGSVQNKERLSSVMKAYQVDTVYHAAAYKHVPMVEFNTIEGIQNNVFGTLCCAQAAVDAGVSTFVLISTDKAVRPTNTMGASKRMAELCLQALAAEPEQKHASAWCVSAMYWVRPAPLSRYLKTNCRRRPDYPDPPRHYPLLHDHSRSSATGYSSRRNG